MNKYQFVFVLYSLLLMACSNKINHFINFKTPSSGEVIRDSKAIKIQMDIAASLSIYSIKYLIDGSEFAHKEDTSGVMLSLDKLALGHRMLTAIIEHENGVDTVNRNIVLQTKVRPKTLKYKTINTFPHDTSAYTQGLTYEGGKLLESTGQIGFSKLKWIELKSGKTLQSVDLDTNYFGEGSVKVKDKIIVLTWRNAVGLVFDAHTLKKINQFPYQSSPEGWGLTYDGKQLWRSDGSNRIWRMNANNYLEEGYIEVYDHNGAVENINELEYIEGKLFANVYQTNEIIIINPHSGLVEASLDLSKLFPKDYFKTEAAGNNVLNGIAYHPSTKRLYITGKKWPTIFELELEGFW